PAPGSGMASLRDQIGIAREKPAFRRRLSKNRDNLPPALIALPVRRGHATVIWDQQPAAKSPLRPSSQAPAHRAAINSALAPPPQLYRTPKSFLLTVSTDGNELAENRTGRRTPRHDVASL